MPYGLILIVAGLVLALATSYVTLGWVLFGIGVGLTVVTFLIFALALGAVANTTKKSYKKYGGF